LDPKARLYHAIAISWPAASPEWQSGKEAHVERLLAEIDDTRVTAVDEDPVTGATRFFFANAGSRDEAVEIIRAIDPAAVAQSVEVSDENWAERSQASITAVRVGSITVAPPWDIPSDGTEVVVIQPSMGFGTAHHESTRLCLQLLQEIDLVGKSVLDVGTGSGVLAIAARRHGATIVIAADYDPDAIQSAQENLELNGVEEIALIELDLAEPEALGVRRFDVVFANLTGGMLQRFASELASRLCPGGSLITSGVTAEEEAAVVRAFETAGLKVASRLQEKEWIGTRFIASASSTPS
jgi:ribosomal protein L11 methyltransferase